MTRSASASTALSRWLIRLTRQTVEPEPARRGESPDSGIPTQETDEIRKRYRRRESLSSRYSILNASVYMAEQEKERALIRWIKTCRLAPVADKRLLEIGCGHGGNLLQFLRLGFSPQNLVGNEFLEGRAQNARQRLPAAVPILVGDASQLDLPLSSFDVVVQSTVFSSILDEDFRARLAAHLWGFLRPGGGVLWYDLLYDNPWNPDVRGIPVGRIRALFPEGRLISWRLTLAPPLSRLVTRLHPSLYRWFAAAPFLRTHVLCWITK